MTVTVDVLSFTEHEHVTGRDSSDEAGRDMALARAFMHASRPAGAEVVAVNERLLMSTSAAAARLGAMDQALLWRWVRACRSHGSAMLPLDARAPVKAEVVPVFNGATRVGFLVTLDSPIPPLRSISEYQEELFSSVLPGTSRQSSRLRAHVARVSEAEANTLFTGEPGTGKSTVAQRILDLGSGRGDTIYEFDARDGDEDGWTGRVVEALRHGQVLLTHLDTLTESRLSTILTAVTRSPYGRLVATAENPDFVGSNSGAFSCHVALPPLRDRLEDLPAIATEVLARKVVKGKGKRLSAGVRRHLWGYSWPGNITELEQVLHRAALRAPTAVIDESCIHLPSSTVGGLGAQRRSLVEPAELDVVRDALNRCGGNKLAAADMLGISRSTLYRKVRALGI